MLIIFDLDDTLIDTSGSILPRKLQNALSSMRGAGLVLSNEKSALDELMRLNHTAKSTIHCITEFIEINGFDPKFIDIAANELRKDDLQEELVTEADGAIEILHVLSQEHKIGLVTAGEKQFQLRKIQLANLPDKLFSRIVVCRSSEKGKHYQDFLKDFHYDPRDVIVCGDRVKQDLRPAKNLGMTTIHIKQGREQNHFDGGLDVDYTIFTLEQVLEVLKKIENKNQLGRL